MSMTPLAQSKARNRHEREASKQRTLDAAAHLRLLKAARQLIVQWRREPGGRYRIPPGAVLALCKAVDESWDIVKGVEE